MPNMNAAPAVPPMNAPAASVGTNAYLTIMASMAGISPTCMASTYDPAARYRKTMKGTSVAVTLPMRLMPPMMTSPTRMASTMPVAALGTSKYSWVSSPTFQAWNMLPPVDVEISRQLQKTMPIKRPSRGRPRRSIALAATYMGPPCGLSRSSVFRYSIASVTSVSLMLMPRKPITHIQNMAPGPPSAMASATPPMLPRPTVADNAADRAWKWLIAPGSSGSS